MTKIYLNQLTNVFKNYLQYRLKKITIFYSITYQRLTLINKQ